MTEIIERGDSYYCYRPKVEAERVENLDDVQRFHLLLVPDGDQPARLILVGRKRMPDLEGDGADSDRRNWAMVVGVGSAKELGGELYPLAYETETRGERRQGEAIPLAAARYVLYEADGDTRLAQRLAQPGKAHHAQQVFGLHTEAEYVVSVRNPAVEVAGFPETAPGYPQDIRERFADERWLGIDDPDLLAYEQAQLLLIGAGTTIDAGILGDRQATDLFEALGLDPDAWPRGAIEQGKLVGPRFEATVKQPAGDRSAGGKRGGQAARSTASAAGIAEALAGTDFPERRAGLVRQAERNDAAPEIIATLADMPARTFHDMAEVAEALAEVR